MLKNIHLILVPLIFSLSSCGGPAPREGKASKNVVLSSHVVKNLGGKVVAVQYCCLLAGSRNVYGNELKELRRANFIVVNLQADDVGDAMVELEFQRNKVALPHQPLKHVNEGDGTKYKYATGGLVSLGNIDDGTGTNTTRPATPADIDYVVIRSDKISSGGAAYVTITGFMDPGTVDTVHGKLW